MSEPLTTDVLCPIITPFENGEISQGALQSTVEHVTSGGVEGLVPCGTTGEFAALPRGDRRTVIQTVIQAAPDTTTIVAGAGATSVHDTLDNIRMSAELGADAALVVLPYFQTASNTQGQLRFLEAVLDQTPLPVILYNIPACVGQGINVDTVRQVVDHERLLGLKESSGDFNYLLRILRETPAEFQVLQGYDSQFVPAIIHGASGGINALTNVIPEDFVAMTSALHAGNIEKAIRIQQRTAFPLFQYCIEYGFTTVCKTGLSCLDVISTPEVRPPLTELDTSIRNSIADLVQEHSADRDQQRYS